MSRGRDDVAHGSMKIGDKSLRGKRTYAGAYNTPGGNVKHDIRWITMVVEVQTDARPCGNFVSFDGRGQIVEKSGRRCDHRSDEDPKREGETPNDTVELLDESVLLRRVY